MREDQLCWNIGYGAQLEGRAQESKGRKWMSDLWNSNKQAQPSLTFTDLHLIYLLKKKKLI